MRSIVNSCYGTGRQGLVEWGYFMVIERYSADHQKNITGF